MGRNKGMSSNKKKDIVKLISDGIARLEIAEKLNADRTIRKEIENIAKVRRKT